MAIIVKLVLWAVAAALCSFVVRLLAFYKVREWHQGGAEDIELVPGTGLALVSSGLIYSNRGDRSVTRGRIFLYDLDEPVRMFAAAELQLVVPPGHDFDKDTFTPHGISSYTSKGRTQLYVINHLPNGTDTVEVFRLDQKARTLAHEKTITHPLIHSANDLVVTGADRFILINDHYFKHEVSRFIEDLLQLKWGDMLFYDGKSAKLLDTNMAMPVGLALSPERDYLYVSLANSEGIAVYRLARDFTITKHTDISLLTTPDNIFVHPDTGHLWVGCHPIVHKAAWHLYQPRMYSAPSQALRIRMQEGHRSWVVTEPMADDGSKLSGSSVAVAYKDNLLVGTVHHRLLHCQITDDELA